MTIEQLWEKYKARCVPSDAGEIQIQETKQAFFAGFMSMFEVNNIISQPGFHEQRAFNLLTNLQQEIDRYIRYKTEEAAKTKSSDPN